jgi:alginate O-acetyltransferase complex protein AlgI
VFFRADSLPGALAFLNAMAGARATAPGMYTIGWYLTPELGLAIVAGVIGSMPVVPVLAAWRSRAAGRDRAGILAASFAPLNTAALMALLVASVMQIAARTYNPFIYFRF